MPQKKTKARKKSTAAKGDLDGSPYLSGLAGGSKKEKRTVAEQMRDALRKELKDDGAAMTLGGTGYSAVEEVMPTGLDVLDHWTFGIGGLPYGRVIEISGPEDVGKSSLVNHLMAAAQRDGAVACLGDAERKVQPNWVDVFKVKRDEVLLLPARTVEEYLQQLTITIRKFGKRHKLVFFLDSVATTIPQKALEQDLNENEIPGVAAAAWSRGLKALNPILSESKAMLVLTNQTRCVSADELVITERGITTAGYAIGDKQIVGRGGRLRAVSGSAISHQAPIRISSKDGRSITCGKNHPILSVGEDGAPTWVKASDIRGGCWVAMPRMVELPDIADSVLPRLLPGNTQEEHVPIPAVANEDFCRFLGMWFSDGALIDNDDKALIFGEKSLDRKLALLKTASALGWKPAKFGNVGFRFGSRIYRLMIAAGCQIGAINKNIPSVITGRRQWRAFLRGMFDGHTIGKGFYLTFENRSAARTTQLALLGFGVNSRACPNRGRKDIDGNAQGAYLYISGVDADRYVKEIGFEEEEKQKKVIAGVGIPDLSSRGKPDVVPPLATGKLRAALKSDGGKSIGLMIRRRLWAAFNGGTNVAARDHATAARAYGFEDSVTMYRWVQVKQAFKLKTKVPMIDFDVPDGEQFVAGGFVTHNTKIGVLYGPTEESACGRAIKYYCSLRLNIGRGKSVKNGDQHVAKWVSVHPMKNHLGPQHRGAKILLNFETGFDDARSTMAHAKEVGCVDPKCQSIKEARQCLGWEKNADAPDEVIADVEAK